MKSLREIRTMVTVCPVCDHEAKFWIDTDIEQQATPVMYVKCIICGTEYESMGEVLETFKREMIS